MCFWGGIQSTSPLPFHGGGLASFFPEGLRHSPAHFLSLILYKKWVWIYCDTSPKKQSKTKPILKWRPWFAARTSGALLCVPSYAELGLGLAAHPVAEPRRWVQTASIKQHQEPGPWALPLSDFPGALLAVSGDVCRQDWTLCCSPVSLSICSLLYCTEQVALIGEP